MNVKTEGYGGRRIKKNIIVRTNEKRNRSHTLRISGYVEQFVTITPKAAYLKGPVGSALAVTVKITPEEKYPFNIVATRAGETKNISYSLRENHDGKGYLLDITNRKKDKGRYREIIRLKTDSTVKSEIKVYVHGRIFEPPVRKKGETPAKALPQRTETGAKRTGLALEL